MKSHIAIVSTAVLVGAGLAGCAKQQAVKPQPHSTATALAACARSVDLPPKLDGAARTGQGQQPVLVVGNGACQSP